MVGGVFAGCNMGDTGENGDTTGGNTDGETHTHQWATAYTADGENGHYHKATCHPDEHDTAVAHTYNESYVCTVCSYEHTHVWSEGFIADSKGNGHYKVSECTSHDDIVKGTMVDHVYDDDMDATCNSCTYVRIPPHQHTWSTTFTNEEAKGHTKTSTCEGHDPVKSEYYSHEFASGSDTCVCGYTREEDTSTALASGSKIYLVGDSTVCSFSDSYYLPRYGYGTQLAKYLNVEESQIVNYAVSGRSSKSFVTDSNGNYDNLKAELKAGDYLIIGFGHNDEKSAEPARFTSAKGDLNTDGSFQKSLNDNYVQLAKNKGATPILCTPITRYDSSGKYTGAKVHDTADGDYAAAIKVLGTATDTTVIDLTKITADIYKADNVAAQYFHAHTTYTGVKPNEVPGGRDDTHINMYGAQMIAYQFANALKDTECSLSAHVITNALAPTKGTDYVAAKNENYVKPDYKPFDSQNTGARRLTGKWFATVMGEVGGATKLSNFAVTYANKEITVSNKEYTNGKITDAQDGFGAAFMQVDATKNFKITVTATLKTVPAGSNNQTGFGIMLRDDILVNMQDGTLASNYVAAGVLNVKGDIFSRENGALTAVNSSSATLTENSSYQLEIERVGQTVTVKVGEHTKKFTDFDFFAVDDEYMYLCLFANRGLEVVFSDIDYQTTGTSQGA